MFNLPPARNKQVTASGRAFQSLVNI